VYCFFKPAKNCIKAEDEEYIQSAAEHHLCGGNDDKGLFHSHQNELPHASEKAQNMKMLMAGDAVVPNTEVPHVTTGGDPKPIHETVLNSHVFIEPGTSEGSRRSGMRKNALGECTEMLSGTDSLLQCKVCGFTFKHQRYLKKHMLIHTGDKPHECGFCGKKFRTKNEHKMHELRHKGKLPQCPVCGGRYGVLSRHMLIHSADRCKHVCSVCQKALRSAATLKQHMKVHTDERPYTCQDCGGRYKSSRGLKYHIRSVHIQEKGEEKSHVCSACGKMFSQTVSLKAHIIFVHTNERPYHCETCDKAFKTKVNLAVHQTVHSSEKPFVCSTCGKCFRLDVLLKRHNLIHTGEQPYECSVCKMRFNQSNSMQRHMLTHTGEKPYSCSDCGTRFTQSGGLASHRLRHCPKRRNTQS